MNKLEKAIERVKNEIGGLELLENEPLSQHSSFKIGGAARVMAMPKDKEELRALCKLLYEECVCPMPLGRGSNILFPDEGLKSAFIISTEKMQSLELLPDGSIYAASGVSLAKLSNFAYQNGLKGLEFASGIPGSLGGGLVMNAGAYGGELKDVVVKTEFYCLNRQDMFWLEKPECCFEYRGSIFKTPGSCVITGANIRLEKGDKEEIAEKMRSLNESRREKQPLNFPSAGSAFKRPEGHFAAALIDEAGLKGYTVGGAQVSEKHAGFVVNAGDASAADVRQLMDDVKRIVEDKSGVKLEPEIIMLSPDYCPDGSCGE
ncbi:MAG: UDP-N-acetylmuramate dehydrogenase [Oscillospiraceae bacterium]|nr:UDP-N-acetylmuramate dehydrogenase [Oscillospiraceae bacterium]